MPLRSPEALKSLSLQELGKIISDIENGTNDHEYPDPTQQPIELYNARKAYSEKEKAGKPTK